jgi:hypothetical protein
VTTAPLVLHASDVRVEIDCPKYCARAIGAVYAPASRPMLPTRVVERWDAHCSDRHWQIRVEGREVERGVGEDVDLAGALETRFIHQLEGWHPDASLLHAALVELEGVPILFGGDSGRGKSSLTREVMRRGGRYFTDELVVTDARRVWAVQRTPVFDFGPADAPLPHWLAGADRESYAWTRPDGSRWARPLFSVPDAQWARAPIAAGDVVVVRLIGRDRDEVVPMTGGEALATLLDASLTRSWRQLGPLAADRRSFGIAWTDPARAVDLLTAATKHLASGPRPPSAP